MALSNWDTLAINELGESTNGVFVSPLGVRIEMYKNWIYGADEVAWQPEGRYDRPFVFEYQHGLMTYKDVTIKAIRGPQSGVYAVVWSGYNENLKVMVGCGVSGYRDKGESDYEWVGVTKHCAKYLRRLIYEWGRGWSGKSAPLEKLIEATKSGLRFNQGDAYFKSALGLSAIATEIGQAEKPLIEGMI